LAAYKGDKLMTHFTALKTNKNSLTLEHRPTTPVWCRNVSVHYCVQTCQNSFSPWWAAPSTWCSQNYSVSQTGDHTKRLALASANLHRVAHN